LRAFPALGDKFERSSPVIGTTHRAACVVVRREALLGLSCRAALESSTIQRQFRGSRAGNRERGKQHTRDGFFWGGGGGTYDNTVDERVAFDGSTYFGIDEETARGVDLVRVTGTIEVDAD